MGRPCYVHKQMVQDEFSLLRLQCWEDEAFTSQCWICVICYMTEADIDWSAMVMVHGELQRVAPMPARLVPNWNWWYWWGVMITTHEELGNIEHETPNWLKVWNYREERNRSWLERNGTQEWQSETVALVTNIWPHLITLSVERTNLRSFKLLITTKLIIRNALHYELQMSMTEFPLQLS